MNARPDVAARARMIAEMAFKGLHVARDLKDGTMIRTCKSVIAMLRMGKVPLDRDVMAIHRMTREAVR